MRPYSVSWLLLLLAGYSAFSTGVCVTDKKDYYEVLDVLSDAKSAEIKRAFRRLAAEHHPDKNKDPAAETRFREIVEAYEVLTDEHLRAVYDKDGYSGLEKFKRGQASSDSQRFRKGQFDVQIEEIIAELLMLFKFARQANNGPRGPKSRPFFIFSPKDGGFPFRFVEPWDLPTQKKGSRDKYKMGEKYPDRERARTHFRQMYSEEVNGGPNQEKNIFFYQKKMNGHARRNNEKIRHFAAEPRAFGKDHHNDHESPYDRENRAYENRRGRRKTERIYEPPGEEHGGHRTFLNGDEFPGRASSMRENKRNFHIHKDGRENVRKGTDMPDVRGYFPTSRLPTRQMKDRRTFIRDTLSKGKQRG
ncbi:uncharacterized protein LOC144871544 [Branchiostoma floridae x Branchiostoma japonicum]